MKRTIFFLSLLLGTSPLLHAQEVDGVSVGSLKMDRNGEYLVVEMDVELSRLEVEANRAVLLTPRLVNGADSAALVAVRGMGPLTAGRIVRYRERLGGFARIGQLREIEGMTDENYRRILQQIWVDSSKIQKIDINFALPLQLRDHPYLPERVLNRLLKYRQLKGGWRSIRDLTEQHIISEQQAEKLSPYLCFRVQ